MRHAAETFPAPGKPDSSQPAATGGWHLRHIPADVWLSRRTGLADAPSSRTHRA
jgi:hypothetical protein